MDHLQTVFCKNNNYPTQITKEILGEEVENKQQSNTQRRNIFKEDDKEEKEHWQLNLPYGGEKGQHLIRELQRNIEKGLKGKVKLRTTYTPCKLGSRFTVKGKTKLIHRHNVS